MFTKLLPTCNIILAVKFIIITILMIELFIRFLPYHFCSINFSVQNLNFRPFIYTIINGFSYPRYFLSFKVNKEANIISFRNDVCRKMNISPDNSNWKNVSKR